MKRVNDPKISPYQVYYKKIAEIKQRLKEGDIVQCKEIDITPYYADNKRCLKCGKPDPLSPYECEDCLTKRRGIEFVELLMRNGLIKLMKMKK